MNIYGLLGKKLGHSLSPEIHKLIFEKLNVHGIYKLYEVSENNIKDVVDKVKDFNIKGLNVTIPYKIKVMDYMDEVSKEVKKIGAINTIVLKNNKMIGYNTDYYGFGMMLKKFKVEVKDKVVVVLGSGGASKAVVQYLKDKGSKKIIIVTRNIKEAQCKFKNCAFMTYNDLKNVTNSEIIVNCTPIGMYPNVDNSIVEGKILKNFKVSVDLIYNPLETLFLKKSKKVGNTSVNGLYMLVGQAIKAQELWNNIKFDEEIIDEIYDKLVEII